MICCSHPGKMGDSIYSLPTVKALCVKHGCKADFYTSAYCEPMRRLVEYQPYINKMVVPPSYVIEGAGMGVQPWKMPVDESKYEAVYHLGFRSNPDKSLPDFIAESARVQRGPIEYAFPEWNQEMVFPYVILAPRGDRGFPQLFPQFIEICPLQVVQIGGRGDFVGDKNKSIDRTGLDMLETLTWLSQANAFVGVFSAMLVLANGFKMTKVVPTDNIRWDLNHAVRSQANFYPVNPSAKDILRLAVP